ncbi:MAG TPA: hypothetical protein VGO47_10895, partial [Chlamydiales bacterium]|nr:hypothetical protein [Chlamydiales bacterium]
MFSTEGGNTASPIVLSGYQNYTSQSVAHLDMDMPSPTDAAIIDEAMIGRTNICPQPMEVTGKGALFQYLEETKDQDTNQGP